MLLVAAIEHRARRLAQAVTRAVAEKCSGLSNYEAGDYLGDEQAISIAVEETRAMRAERAERAERWRQAFVDADAEQEVAEPSYVDSPHRWQKVIANGPPIDMRDIKVGDKYCLLCGKNITFVRFHSCPVVAGIQTPTAGQRGESPVGDDSPTLPAGSPSTDAAIEKFDEFIRCYVDQSLHAHFADNDDNAAEYVRRAIRDTTDPSPTIASRQHQPSVRGEGFPADSDIPPSPAGERPNWVDWAVPAICDVLAIHQRSRDGYCVNAEDIEHLQVLDQQAWREHVAPLIADRLEAASKARFCIDDGEPQTVALNAVEYERFLDGWLNPGREHAAHRNTPK